MYSLEGGGELADLLPDEEVCRVIRMADPALENVQAKDPFLLEYPVPFQSSASSRSTLKNEPEMMGVLLSCCSSMLSVTTIFITLGARMSSRLVASRIIMSRPVGRSFGIRLPTRSAASSTDAGMAWLRGTRFS
jgi:hypothetical protein